MGKKQYLFTFLVCLPLTALATSPQNLRFESAEHIFMGNQVILQGLPKLADNSPIKFTLDNGLQLSYGVILAMPDFYGDPDHQISSENTFEKRKQRFSTVFQSFSHYDTSYFHDFWPIIQKERDDVAAALKAHESVNELYERIIEKQLITLEWVTHLKFFALAENCFDHFDHDAWLAYQAGHAVAVDTAITGYNIVSGKDTQTNTICASATDHSACLMQLATKNLALAYEENAYANHFLTDHMASSHIRTPFRALVTTRPVASLGAIAGNYMHNEDGKYGVIVTNNSGHYWIAYGDEYYFSDQNTSYRMVIQSALQNSANEIYDAFTKGYDTDPQSAQLQGLIPTPIPVGKTVSVDGYVVTQSAPLYQVMNGAVWERKEVNNRFDNEWTPSWTTIQLMLTYHLTTPSDCWKWLLQKQHSYLVQFLNKNPPWQDTGYVIN